MVASNWLRLRPANILCPMNTRATSYKGKGRMIGYGLVSEHHELLIKACLAGSCARSPHMGIHLRMNMQAEEVMLRAINVPRPIRRTADKQAAVKAKGKKKEEAYNSLRPDSQRI